MTPDPSRKPANATQPSRVYPDDPELRSGSSVKVAPGSPATLLLVVLISLASLVSVLWHLQDSSVENANTGSRYATVESLVDYGTYAIDQSIYRRTIDKVKIGERYYSSKPPLLPTATAGIYWMYRELTGETFQSAEGNVVRFLSLMTGWLAQLVFLIYLYKTARLFLKSELAVLALSALGAFAYLGAGYATTLNNHSIAAAVGWVGFYYAARVRHGEHVTSRDWLLSGLCLGFLPSFDLPGGLITAAVFVYLASFDRKKALLWFAPALLVGVGLHAFVTYFATGSLIPVYLRRALYDYPGSYWNREAGIDALREPKHIYAFHVLLGHHGLFSMTPVFLFGAYELYRTLRHKLALAAEAWLTVGITTGLSLFYIFSSHNYGGWCVGMRWLVPAMPFLLLFTAIWLERIEFTRLLKTGFVISFAVSVFHVQDALDGPFQFSVWHNWLEGKPNRGRTGKVFNVGNVPRKAR